jgi:hypothetical protein
MFGWQMLQNDEEVKDAIKESLNGLAAEVYDEGIKKSLHAMTRA